MNYILYFPKYKTKLYVKTSNKWQKRANIIEVDIECIIFLKKSFDVVHRTMNFVHLIVIWLLCITINLTCIFFSFHSLTNWIGRIISMIILTIVPMLLPITLIIYIFLIGPMMASKSKTMIVLTQILLPPVVTTYYLHAESTWTTRI